MILFSGSKITTNRNSCKNPFCTNCLKWYYSVIRDIIYLSKINSNKMCENCRDTNKIPIPLSEIL